MDRKTTEFLNALNRHFYAAQAASFSETRTRSWAGWLRLLPWLEALPGQARAASASHASPIYILDLGCGNGRFFGFLRDHLQRNFVYQGVDASAALLAHARRDFAADARASFCEAEIRPGSHHTACARDGAPQSWDFIAAFGLLHHLPGFENRAAFLIDAAQTLRAGGLLGVTFWQFAKFERFQRKIVSWSTQPSVDPTLLEGGDFLLAWGASPHALRYCHFADDAELTRLRVCLEAAGAHRREAFSADGETGELNLYWLIEAREQRRLEKEGAP